MPLFFVILGAQVEFRALFGSSRVLLLAAGLVATAVLLHVLLKRPGVVGLLATASLGVPSAVVSIGLSQGALDPAQAAAIITAALVSIAVSTAGGALLVRRAARDLPVDPVGP